MINAILFVAVMLLLGVIARTSIPVLRLLYIPGSVVAGFIGLAIVQFAPERVQAPITAISDTLSSWPGFLIAVIFAGMLLETRSRSSTQIASRVGRQTLMVWIIVLGETAVGLLVTAAFILPLIDVPNSFGMLIETGFAGGHGTAAAMGDVFSHPSIQFPQGRDLGMLMATAGLIYGLVSGILLINIGIRRGWVNTKANTADLKDSKDTVNRSDQKPIGTARIGGEIIDPLLFQLIWITIAFGIGLLLHTSASQVGEFLDPQVEAQASQDTLEADASANAVSLAAKKQLDKRLSWSNLIGGFPLFIFTLLGGLVVHHLLRLISQGHRVDSDSINRISSTAMDLLVVAAITSLNLQAVLQLAVPFLIVVTAGCLWAVFCLVVVSRWILPSAHWFKLGLINYGMSTGTTATGFVLLRIIDPELESDAAEDYALAAPLSAPFIGGGMITIALPLLVLENVSIWIPALVLCGIVMALIVVGKKWNSSQVND